MKPARFLPEAEQDLLDAAQFLENRQKGLGARLLSAVEGLAARLEAHPASGSRVNARVRKSLVPGFPYSVLYHETKHELLFLAVAHHKRRPGFWLPRIRQIRGA